MSKNDQSGLVDLDASLAELVGGDLLLACKVLLDGRQRWRERAEAAEAQVAALQRDLDIANGCHATAMESLRAAEAQVAELKKDAERYRWIKDQLDGERKDDALMQLIGDSWSDELDIRVDAAKESGVSP